MRARPATLAAGHPEAERNLQRWAHTEQAQGLKSPQSQLGSQWQGEPAPADWAYRDRNPQMLRNHFGDLLSVGQWVQCWLVIKMGLSQGFSIRL